jgi:hypothetical protein
MLALAQTNIGMFLLREGGGRLNQFFIVRAWVQKK